MISSYMELLEQELGDELTGETAEYMEFAADGANRMKAMIDGLLQYSRVQTDGDPFETVDADELLDEILQDLESKFLSRESKSVVSRYRLSLLTGANSDRCFRTSSRMRSNMATKILL